MSVTARMHTKLAAALLTAGMVATAPAVVGAGSEALPVLSNIDVRPASFVTDALYAGGDAVSALTNAVEIGVDLAVGLNYFWDDSDYGYGVPVNPLSLAAAALQNPGSAVSYLAQLFLNPSDNYGTGPDDDFTYYYTYPWYFKAYVVEQLVRILPAALSTPIIDAINNISDGINNFFATALPDPTPAIDSIAQTYGGQPGWSLYAVQNALAVPTQLLSALTYYVAYLPANVEATVESAIQSPTDIPGLVSNLIYAAFSPDYFQGNTLEQGGLLGNVTWIVTKPFRGLPAPISDLVENIYAGFTSTVSNLLSNLPAPITPTPFAAASSAAATASTTNVAAQEDSSAAAEPAASPKAAARLHSDRKSARADHSSSAGTRQTTAKRDNTTKATGSARRASKTHGAA